MQPKGLPYDSIVMRELGQSFADRGFFEVNLASGSMEWANNFVLEKYGMTLEQIQAMTLFDLVPSEHHDALTSSVADETKGRSQKFSIWPGKAANGKLVWWYVTKAKGAHPYHWYKAEYLNTTEKTGPEYASMLAAMQTANSYNDLAARLLDHQEWTQHEISRLIHLKTDMSDQFAKQTTEILRLIGTDTIHEQRMASFETSIKKAASEAAQSAIKEITVSAEKAGKAITVQAHKAGQGLAKKVTVPVSLIAAFAAIAQWLINTYLHK